MKKLAMLALLAAGMLMADVTVPRVATAPAVDGVIEIEEWAGCKIDVPFTVPVTKEIAKNPVELYMGYDDSHIYIALKFTPSESAKNDTKKGFFNSPRVELRFGEDEQISIFGVAFDGRQFPGKGWNAVTREGVIELSLPLEMIHGYRVYKGNVVMSDGKESLALFPLGEASFTDPRFHQYFYLGSKAEIEASKKALASQAESELRKTEQLAAQFKVMAPIGMAVKSAKECKVAKAWKPYVFEQSGKDFHFVFLPKMTDFSVPNVENSLPLFQDAAYQVHCWELDHGMRQPLHTLEKLLANKSAAATHILTKCDNPIYYSIDGGYHTYEDMLQISKEARDEFVAKYGKRLLALDENESVGPSGGFPMIMGLAGLNPQNKKEAYEALKSVAFDTRRTFIRDWAVFYPELQPYRSPVSATFTDHLYLSMGFRMAGCECGPKTLCMPFSYAVSRGAARQYGRPYRIYLTTHEDKIVFPGWEGASRHYTFNDYRRALFPGTRRHRMTKKGDRVWFLMEGPEFGVQHMDWYRCFVYAYMAGANTFFDECGHYLMYARYDYKTIDKEDPLLVNLRDIKHYLSSMGEMMSDFYDNIVCKEDRGVIYTPVAIMWDQYHGHFSNYHGTPWGLFDNTEGDLMMHALMNSLFPEDKEKICYSRGFRTSAHGDVFDVITNASSQETLNGYPAIFFCGDVPIDDAFAAKLAAYVKRGGKLAINYKQVESVVDKFPRGFFGAEITAERRKARISYSRFSGKTLEERIPFTYTVAQAAKGTEVPVFTANDARDPLVLISKYGKGRVILTMPDFLKERYSNSTMLNIFHDLMLQLGREALPVTIDGDIQFHVNRNKKGWLVVLYNNYGVGFNATWQYPQRKPDSKFDVKVTVTPKFKAKSVREWFTGSKDLTLTVLAGDIRILEIRD